MLLLPEDSKEDCGKEGWLGNHVMRDENLATVTVATSVSHSNYSELREHSYF